MLESKLARQILIYSPLWLGLEYLVAFVICGILTPSDRAFNALLLIGALYCFRIVNALINTILSIPMYYLTKQQRVNDVTALLYANNVPVIDEMISKDGAIEIFEALIKHEETTEQVKLFSVRTLGELAGIRVTNRMILFVQTQFILEAAISRYVAEKNARG